MKKTLTKLTAILLTAVLGLTDFSLAAAAKTPVKVVLNGEVLSFSVDPIVVDDRTYVEFRTLFTKLGYQVDYDDATRTIKATSPQRQIEMTLGNDTVLVNGSPVDGKDQIRLVNDRTMVGVRFVSTLSGKEVLWDGTTQTVTIRDKETSEEEKAVLQVFDKLLLLEAARDTEGAKALFTADTPVDVDAVAPDWSRVQTKTTYEEITIESLSDSEAIVKTTEVTVKIGGTGFLPDNRSEFRYTLHQEDGQWKIHDLEVLGQQALDPYRLFDQAVTVPSDMHAALKALVETRIKAVNEKNYDALLATTIFESEEEYTHAILGFIRMSIYLDVVSTLEKFAVVEYNGSDEAVVLYSVVSDVSSDLERTKNRAIVSGVARKKNGNWFLESKTVTHYMEMIE